MLSKKWLHCISDAYTICSNKLLLKFFLFHFLFEINSITCFCDELFTDGLSAMKNEIKGIVYLFFVYKYQRIYRYDVIKITTPYIYIYILLCVHFFQFFWYVSTLFLLLYLERMSAVDEKLEGKYFVFLV